MENRSGRLFRVGRFLDKRKEEKWKMGKVQ